jgi:transposase InsO family protein
MSREAHVRFCESPEVRFLRATHPYVPTWSGFLFLAVVLDVFSRRIVGWSARENRNGTGLDKEIAPTLGG